MSEHEGVVRDDGRVVCSCGDFNCASLSYTACSFALGRGRYCKGDARWPETHSTLCPGYSERTAS